MPRDEEESPTRRVEKYVFLGNRKNKDSDPDLDAVQRKSFQVDLFDYDITPFRIMNAIRDWFGELVRRKKSRRESHDGSDGSVVEPPQDC